MIAHFAEVLTKLKAQPRRVVCAVAAADRTVLETLCVAHQEGVAEAVAVGDAAQIREWIQAEGWDFPLTVIDRPDPAEALAAGLALIRRGEAAVLMKGLVNSSDFLKAVLADSRQYHSEAFLSHLAAFEIPGVNRLVFTSDGGMNIAPDLVAKQRILKNALVALHCLGYSQPQVAVVTANEAVRADMPATIDAAALVEAFRQGAFPDCRLEGPIAMDVAISPEAAAHKGIRSEISGRCDLLLMPNIEAGNISGKILMYWAGAQMAGLILGADYPIVMTSRAETAAGKLYSLALACLMQGD